MSKAMTITEKGPKTYPVVIRREEYTKRVETITISGRTVTVESVNVIDRIHPDWYPFFLEMGYNFNTRLKKLFCLCYSVGLDPRPLPEDTFNVFSMSPYDIKVVVVAQDPYPQLSTDVCPGQGTSLTKAENTPGTDKTRLPKANPVACGYSFATQSIRTPPSLERIRLAVVKEFGPITIVDPEHPNSLKGWIQQGVFLLNNTPVYFGKGSLGYSDNEESSELKDIRAAAKDCWKGVTEQICKHIISKQKDCRFLLVGSEAHYLERHVTKAICTNHPSTRSDCSFTGDCFRALRQFTIGSGDTKKDVEIQWEIM